MMAFGKFFRAKNVSGYTWYIVTEPRSIDFPKGTDAKKVEEILKPYLKFIIDNRPDPKSVAATCASKGVRVDFLMAYGSKDLGVRAVFPLKGGQERTIKPLNEAEKLEIRSEKLPSPEEELRMDLAGLFQYVTVTFPGR